MFSLSDPGLFHAHPAAITARRPEDLLAAHGAMPTGWSMQVPAVGAVEGVISSTSLSSG
jgi:hypothetical protein